QQVSPPVSGVIDRQSLHIGGQVASPPGPVHRRPRVPVAGLRAVPPDPDALFADVERSQAVVGDAAFDLRADVELADPHARDRARPAVAALPLLGHAGAGVAEAVVL